MIEIKSRVLAALACSMCALILGNCAAKQPQPSKGTNTHALKGVIPTMAAGGASDEALLADVESWKGF